MILKRRSFLQSAALAFVGSVLARLPLAGAVAAVAEEVVPESPFVEIWTSYTTNTNGNALIIITNAETGKVISQSVSGAWDVASNPTWTIQPEKSYTLREFTDKDFV